VARLKKWWETWGGHVCLALAIILLAVVIFLLWVAIDSTNVRVVFQAVLWGVCLLFIVIGLTSFSIGALRSRGERYYIRREARYLTGLEPPGRNVKATKRQSAPLRKSPVSGAHSPRDEEL